MTDVQAPWMQRHACNKSNHLAKMCQSQHKLQRITKGKPMCEHTAGGQGSDDAAEKGALCRIFEYIYKTMFHNRLICATGNKQTKSEFQIDTGAECNIIKYSKYLEKDK